MLGLLGRSLIAAAARSSSAAAAASGVLGPKSASLLPHIATSSNLQPASVQQQRAMAVWVDVKDNNMEQGLRDLSRCGIIVVVITAWRMGCS